MIRKGIYKKELMGEHYVTQTWVSDRFVEVPVGDTIEFKGQTFTLLEPYVPIMRDELECEYDVKYEAEEQGWRKHPMMYIEGAIKESEFTTDSKIDVPLTHLIRSIKDSTGKDYTFFFDYDLTDNRTVTFTDDDILSALNRIADVWECEWWIEGSEIHLGWCRLGDEIDLLVGEHIKPPTFTESEELYSKYRVFGSDRNIEKHDSTSNISVKARLTLPPSYAESTIVVDTKTNYTKTLVFEDVYPRSPLKVSAVEVSNLYKVKFGDFELTDDDIIKGETPMVHFNSGALEGRDFELERSGDWFVVVQTDGDIKFPNDTIKPAVGDDVVLWNIKMPQEYIDSAQEELEQLALQEIADRQLDTRQYTARTNPVEYPYVDRFDVGQKVLYKKVGIDGVEYITNARLLSIEYDLENEKDGTLIFGNERAKGAIATLREQIEGIKQQPKAKDGTSIKVAGRLDSTDDLPLDPKKGDAYLIDSKLYVWNGVGWVVEDLKGDRGDTPYIKGGFWWVGDESTGIKAEGEDGTNGIDGENGLTPYIGTNGNWWVGDTDLGVSAEGKSGAVSYMAGLYNSATTYKATKKTRPIVFQPTGTDQRVGKYYYPLEIGEYKNISPKDNPSIWGVVDDFSVMLVDTLVANFAKIGGAVFYGDWMYSQRGFYHVSGDQNDEYELFDGNIDGAWEPLLAMNMRTGKFYAQDGYFRGEIEATSGKLEDVTISTNSTGHKIVISPAERGIFFYDTYGVEVGSLTSGTEFAKLILKSYYEKELYMDGDAIIMRNFTGDTADLRANSLKMGRSGEWSIDISGHPFLIGGKQPLKVNMYNLPTSTENLGSGDLWNNNGTLKIVP